MQGRERGEGKSKSKMGLRSLSQGSRIRAWNGEGRAGLRCGVPKMETKVCGGTGYAVEDFRAWVMGMCGSEFRCSVTRSVRLHRQMFFSSGHGQVSCYILAPSGLTMDSNNVKVIQDWPKPRKVKDVQAFLDFTNFYRRFIHNYSGLTVPLAQLTQKGTPWSFSNTCQTLFKTLKQAFITTLVLAQ